MRERKREKERERITTRYKKVKRTPTQTEDQ